MEEDKKAATTSSPSSAHSLQMTINSAIYGRGSPARYIETSQQSSTDLKWMREALKMAQEAFQANEVPVGSVFVRKDEIICRARNRTNELMNATRHAELEAIDYILKHYPPKNPAFALDPHSKSTQETEDTRDGDGDGDNPFKDTTLYVTVEPCIMCGTALRMVGIKRVVFGCGNERFGGNGSVLGANDE